MAQKGLHMKETIYLDNAATTYPKPEIVYSTMDKFLRTSCVNAGRGSYKLATEANSLIEETRKLLLNLVNSKNGKVMLSPSATIAINQVLRGLDWKKIKNVYVSPFEHNAIIRTLWSLKKIYDFEINIIPFDNISFELDESDLKVKYVKNNPDLIIMSHVSNVTGFILPIKKCNELAEKYNPISIVDCAQSLGVVPVDVTKDFFYCDFIIFAGHKSLYGPFGIGGFIQLTDKVKLDSVITGGTGSDSTNLEMPEDEHKYEAGSYNVSAIAGLNAGIKWINSIGIEEIYTHKKKLCELLIEGLEQISDVEVYRPEDLDNHIGVVAFNLEGYSANDIGEILDDDFNICVRTGHHCAPFIGGFLDGKANEGTVRISLGYFNKLEDIKKVVSAIDIIQGG